MKALGRRPDHCVALGIECDDGDRIPVSGVPCPAPRGSCPCTLVERMASLQDGVVLAGMSLCRTDVADAAVAVAVIVVVQVNNRKPMLLSLGWLPIGGIRGTAARCGASGGIRRVWSGPHLNRT